jgi:hypothetical protein
MAASVWRRQANVYRERQALTQRGNDIGARNYGSIASILKHGLDKAYAAERVPEAAPIWHGNIRGGGYYH